ncbi:hypothetical protein TCAL_04115, partial [Tigriopus californicus]
NAKKAYSKSNREAEEALTTIKVLHEAGHTDKDRAKRVGYNVKSVYKVFQHLKARNGDPSITVRSGRPVTATTATNVHKVKEMARTKPIRNLRDITEHITSEIECGRYSDIGGLSQFNGTNWNIAKSIWLILFIAGTSATLIQLHSIMTTYFEYNVVTSVTNTEVQSLDFPAVTICNQNAVHCGNLKDLIWNLNSTQNNDSQSIANLCQLYIQVNCAGSVLMAELFSNGYPSNKTICNLYTIDPSIDLDQNKSNDKFFKLRDEFDKIYDTISPEHKMIIAHQPDKMFKRCTFQSIVDTSIHCQLLLNGTGKIYHPTYGYCYTFNSNIEGRSEAQTAFAGPYYGFSVEVDIERSYYMRVSATQNEGIAVAIHPPNKDPLLATTAINVLTNTLTSIAVSQSEISRQAAPYTSNCSTSWNRSSMPDLEGTKDYQSALCQGKCLFDQFLEKCECSLNHLYTISDSNPKRACLVHTLDRNCTEKGAIDLTSQILKEKCICPAECNAVFYEYSINSVRWPSHVFWADLAGNYEVVYQSEVISPKDAFEVLSSLDPNSTLMNQYESVKTHVESNFLKLQVYFADNIGGLSQFNATNWNIAKSIWIILFIGGTSATLTQLYNIMTMYFEYNVITSVTNIEVQSLDFPAVTICNQNAVHCGNLRDLILNLHSTQTNDCQIIANLCQLYIQVYCAGSVLMTELFSNGYPSNNTVCNYSVNGSSIDLNNSNDKFSRLRDEFDRIYDTISPKYKMIIAHQSEKMFKRCTFRSIVDTSIHCQLLLNGTSKIYHPTYGYCYTFNSNVEGRSTAETAFAGPYYGFSVEVDIERSYYMRTSATQNEGIAVAIHSPDKDPLLATSAINVLTNTLTSIALRQSEAHLLGAPYTSNCSASWKRSSMPNLEGTRRYHAALCQGKCLFDIFKKHCNCSLNHLYTISDSNPKRTCLVHTEDQACTERGAGKVTSGLLKEQCVCPAECNDVFYEYNTNSVRWPSHVFWTELANSYQVQYKGDVLEPSKVFETFSSSEPNSTLMNQYEIVKAHVESNFLKLQVYFADNIGGLSQHHATNWNISKAIWLVLFIGGTSATLTQLYSIMTTYFEYNVVTSVTNTEVQSLNFPAVTICNQNAVHCGNLKDLIWILNSTQSNDSQSLANLCQLYIQVNCPGSVLMTELFSNGYPSNNTVCNSDVARPKIDLNSEDKFFKLRDEFDKIYNTISPEHKMIIAHQPDKMFKRCTFQSIVDTSIHCQLLLNGTGKIYHPTYGYCYTFNSNIEGRSKAETAFAGPYYGFSVEVDIERSYYMRVSATQNEGIAVAIHPPDKDPLLATSAINVLTNTLTSIALKQMWQGTSVLNLKSVLLKMFKEKVWTWFLTFTTIGGLSHFQGTNWYVSKAMWIVLFFIGIIATTSQIYFVLINYYEYNVITSVTNDEAQTMNFPAVTICNANRVHCGNLKDLIRNLSIEEANAPDSPYKFFILRDEFMIQYDKLQDNHKRIIGHQPDKMFGQCIFESLVGTSKQCKELLNGTVQVYHPEFGVCYSFNGLSSTNPGTVTPFSGPFYGFSVEINIEQSYYMRRAATQTEGIIVAIHPPEKDPLLVTNAINVLPNTLTRIAITEVKEYRQPEPYSSNCTQTWNRTSMPHLDGTRPYHSALCQIKCLYDIMRDLCNCSLNQLYTIDDNKSPRICLVHQEDKVCIEAAAMNLTDAYLRKQCICPAECENLYYDVNLNSIKWPSQTENNATVKEEYDKIEDYVEKNFLKLEVYFANKYIRKTKETKEFPLAAILSSVGGAISLWVGASFITLFEFVDVTNDEAQTMNFPAVTICNANRVHCGNLKTLIVNLSQEKGTDETIDLLCQVFTQVNCRGAVSLAEIFSRGSQDPTKCKEFLNGTVKVYHPHFGYCYTFNGLSSTNPGTVTPFSGPFYGFSVEINIEQLYYMLRAATQNEGIIVSIHPPEKDPLLVTNAINILPNTLTRIAVTEAKEVRQPYPYISNCTHTWNRTSMPHLDGTRPYHSALCQTNCLYDIMRDLCNCSLNQLYTIENEKSQRICLIHEDDKVCIEAAAMNLTDAYLKKRCICPAECENRYYDVNLNSIKWPSQVFWPDVANVHQIQYKGEVIHPKPIFNLLNTAENNATAKAEYDNIKNHVEGNFLKLEVYFANKYIRKTKETKEFPLAAILSSVGGAISLWVGASFITLFEFVELALRLLVNFYFKAK